MRGVEAEFERVAMPHARSLLRFAVRLTHASGRAEDLVQETLLLAWRSFHQFEPGTNARAWLFRILINAFHADHRKARTFSAVEPLTADLPTTPQSPLDSLEVLQALDRLAEEQRTVLLLAVVEGFTCREIAGIASIPIGTVMSRLSRARAAMRESLSLPNGQRNEKVAR